MQNVQAEIQRRLDEVVEKKGIRILYACESGSRGWGFHSPDSDYDVRFVYVHERDWYFSLQERSDNIDMVITDDLDLNGWDLRKFLKLAARSNATPFEWLQSPTVYRQETDFQAEAFAAIAPYFEPKHLLNHYLGIARSSIEKGLQGEQFNIKKYFYVLRPLLAAQWIVVHKSIPPMEFAPLRSVITDQQVQAEVEGLLEKKRLAKEKSLIPVQPVIQAFITEQMQYCQEQAASFSVEKKELDPLNAFFRKTVLAT
ncbi:MAG: nucleotidyltransferase domain-containing protein [Bacteroidota bacterium]